MHKISSIALFATLGLAACDEIDSDIERAAVGAAVGCVAGEVLVDGRCVEGAVIGGAVGAISDDL
ncbi:MAG: osmotically-inducible lipoprotein B [Silicimonas sp.]|nr:osmotically-inducible lipoprotein B [Silicimonas sp.]